MRLSANFHRIYTLMQRLYGSQENCEIHLEKLLLMLFEMYHLREESLKKVDRKREIEQDWLLSQELVGMSLYTNRFAGTLQDFKEKIPYLEELGVNYIHLMPLLEAPDGSNDGGYAVSNYQKVNPKFGTMEDLREITKMFREKGMCLMLDMVMNHTSDQHEWALQAKQGNPTFQDFYHCYENRSIPNQFEATMPQVFPESAPGNFTYVASLEKWVMTVFHNYQWDLNYTNPNVFVAMTQNLLFLANQGVDVLRMDAVAFTWKKIGTTCQNLEEAHLILQLMKACCQVTAPGLALLAEAIVAPEEVVKYFGLQPTSGYECDIAYHATLMALLWEASATKNTKLLYRSLENLPQKPYGTTWITYLRCHDDIGLGFEDQHIREVGYHPIAHRDFLVRYYSGDYENSTAKGAPFMFNPATGEARISGSLAALVGLENALKVNNSEAIEMAIDQILMLHAIILSFGGLPMLYYGDELGTTNNYDYLKNADEAYDNRWMHRPVIDWKKAEKRIRKSMLKKRGTGKKNSPESEIFNGLKHLIQLRKITSEFADKNSLKLEYCENSHLLAFLRWDSNGHKTLIMCNFDSKQHFAHEGILYRCGFFDRNKLVDRVTNKAPHFFEGNIEFAPYQFYWLSEQ